MNKVGFLLLGLLMLSLCYANVQVLKSSGGNWEVKFSDSGSISTWNCNVVEDRNKIMVNIPEVA